MRPVHREMPDWLYLLLQCVAFTFIGLAFAAASYFFAAVLR